MRSNLVFIFNRYLYPFAIDKSNCNQIAIKVVSLEIKHNQLRSVNIRHPKYVMWLYIFMLLQKKRADKEIKSFKTNFIKTSFILFSTDLLRRAICRTPRCFLYIFGVRFIAHLREFRRVRRRARAIARLLCRSLIIKNSF